MCYIEYIILVDLLKTDPNFGVAVAEQAYHPWDRFSIL